MAPDTGWPKAPAIYEIYPRSFMDTNGDGIGDLAGITQRLDHVADLGVDAIWLAPFFVSPWKDGGYDVMDYTTVDPRLGTLDDFLRLVERAHELGLKVMIDQVMNHTSASHPWFAAACAGDDEMAERYLFRDPKPDGSAPNNWMSFFGGPAWEWNHTREQYFFHQFLTSQPSLNLRHPAVKDELARQIGVWRERGVDGFRFDAVTAYLWDESLADNPPASPEVKAKMSGPKFSPYAWQDHEFDMLPGDGAAYTENLRRWAGHDAYLIGEVGSGNRSFELAMRFSGPGRLDAAYTIDLPERAATAPVIAEAVAQTDLMRFPSWLYSHDQPRPDAQVPAEMLRFKALLMAFLPGPWILYQGEELGLYQPELNHDEVTDPFDLRFWPDGPGRENARVPLPWETDAPNMGFTTGTPWLPMRWTAAHVDNARAPGGMLEFYRTLLTLRRTLHWDTARVAECAFGDDWITLTLACDHGSFRGHFAYPGSTAPFPDPAEDVVLAVGDPAETDDPRAVIWQLS